MKRFAFATATALLIAGTAFAGTNVFGSWKGKTKINRAKLPPTPNAQQRDQQLAMIEKATFTLSINKNGTFSWGIAGIPTPDGKPIPPRTGTWTLKGKQLALTVGKTKMPPQVFTISKDGKSFSIENQGLAVTTFTR